MRKTSFAILLALVVGGCGDDDNGASNDADVNAPDADPNAPDADLTQPDAATPSCEGIVPVQGKPEITTELVAEGFSAPVAVMVPPGETRLFVADKPGLVYIIENGEIREPAFLDIQSLVKPTSPSNEQGFLGLAFHPDYAINHRFYVYYNDRSADYGKITLAEYTATGTNEADPSTGKILLTIDHSENFNHNGGWLAFGPDGKLFMATGDGGGGGDPFRSGQDVHNYLAKILRLDVDTAGTYEIPSDNPAVKDEEGQPGLGEIWAYGVRNPWRNSFDRKTGDLYIADVGQDELEELNVEPASSEGGNNYGWSVMEGDQCYRPASGCDQTGKVIPIYEYSHNDFNDGHASITGGFVYRGCKMPGYDGTYFFGDAVHSLIRSLKWDGADGYTDLKEHAGLGLTPYGFGVDLNGEILVCNAAGGTIERLVPAP